jgi:hypothetical protein
MSSYFETIPFQETDQQLVVDRLDHDFFRRILTDVEPQLDLLLTSIVLDQGRVEAAQPVPVTPEATAFYFKNFF